MITPTPLLDSDGNDVVITAGTDFEIVFTLTENGETFDISNSVITSSIRQEGRSENILEDHSVAITTGASGIATMTLLDTETVLLGKPKVNEYLETIKHISDVKVVEQTNNVVNCGPYSFLVRRPIT